MSHLTYLRINYFAEAVFKNVGLMVNITYAHCGVLIAGTIALVVISFAASVLLFEKYLQ